MQLWCLSSTQEVCLTLKQMFLVAKRLNYNFSVSP